MEIVLTNRHLNTLAATAALLCCLTLSQTPALAQALPVPAAGTMTDFPEAHELPDPKLDYKIAFNVETMAASPDQVSPALKGIGTLINTFEKHGVSPSHMHFTAVFHGTLFAPGMWPPRNTPSCGYSGMCVTSPLNSPGERTSISGFFAWLWARASS